VVDGTGTLIENTVPPDSAQAPPYERMVSAFGQVDEGTAGDKADGQECPIGTMATVCSAYDIAMCARLEREHDQCDAQRE
jgi:hypothetical protein